MRLHALLLWCCRVHGVSLFADPPLSRHATVILAIVRSSHWLFAIRTSTAASLTRDWVSVRFFPILLLDGATKHLLSMFDDLNKRKINLTNSYITNKCKLCLRPHTALWCARHRVNGQTRCIGAEVHLSSFSRVLPVIRCFIKFDVFPLLHTQIFKHLVHVAVLESATV